MKKKLKDKVYIVPTFYGFIFSGGAFACWLGALFYSNNLAYLLCFFLIILFIIGMLQSNNNLKNLSLQKIDIDVLPAQSEVSGTVLWLKSNHADAHVRLNIVGKLENKREVLFGEIDLLPQKTMHALRVTMKTQERGKKTIRKIKVSSRYPFGLFYVWRTFKIQKDYLVYPRPAGQLNLPEPQDQGQAQSLNDDALGEDFQGHKKYEAGDSPRRIDWKAYARAKPLLTKVFDEGDSGFLSLNANDINLPFEQALQQLSQWAILCNKRQVKYEVIVGGKKLPVGFGLTHKKRVLSFLADPLFEEGSKP